MIRYGKASAPLIVIKSNFFTENVSQLEQAKYWAQLYASQPQRTRCVICNAELGTADFVKLDVGYAYCSVCGHLNGLHEDTDSFCDALYSANDGRDYAQTYLSADRDAYSNRVNSIYFPKVEFLFSVLEEKGEEPANMNFTDIGAGSGYLLAALALAGAKTMIGYEVSAFQVEYGNQMLGKDILKQHSLTELKTLIAGSDTDVLCMIGALEHVQQPREILKAIVANQSIKYLYLSLPMMSLCVFLEMVFPEVMPRQLTGGHTHLFTNSSLDYIYRSYGLEPVGEWWFGTDMVDLYREVLVSLAARDDTEKVTERWREVFVPLIDDAQGSIDRRKCSSEVHLVLKIKR